LQRGFPYGGCLAVVLESPRRVSRLGEQDCDEVMTAGEKVGEFGVGIAVANLSVMGKVLRSVFSAPLRSPMDSSTLAMRK
jgi:hypothetical protein